MARSQPLRRKYKGPAEIVGSARLIMTANNMNLLGNSEYLSSEDVGALQNRILYIYSDKNSEDFLNSLSHDEREDFVKGDILAKHALWLRDNRKVEIGPRLLVPGNTSRFYNSLATATGIRSALCDWLTSYLQEPNLIDNTGKLLVRIDSGELFVNSKVLNQNWGTYETNTKPPTAAMISAGLSGLSNGKRQLPAQNNKPTNYWRIRTDLLLSWNMENDHATDQEIIEALKNPTKR
jgi:hypothetical protein